MKFSERLGEISTDQLQIAADRFDLGKIGSVEPLTEGLFGQNLLVVMRDGARWVFRGAPHWPWQFEKEKFFVSRLVDQTDAPVPSPYVTSEDPTPFDWPFAWIAYLPGESPRKLLSAGLAAAPLALALADALAELHRLKFDVVGEYDPTTGSLAAERDFANWFDRSLDIWLDRVEETEGALTDTDHELIDRLRVDAHDALRIPFEPAFVHYDFKLGNVSTVVEDGACRVAGVFDFMTAAAGDGEQDLSRIVCELGRLGSDVVATFLERYHERHPLRRGCTARFNVYMLMDRLILWEYGRRNDLWFDADSTFSDFLRPSLEWGKALPLLS